MSDNIESTRKWYNAADAKLTGRVGLGIRELLTLYDHHQSPVGKAESVLVKRIRQAVLGGEAWTFPSFESGIRSLANAIAAEGEKEC